MGQKRILAITRRVLSPCLESGVILGLLVPHTPRTKDSFARILERNQLSRRVAVAHFPFFPQNSWAEETRRRYRSVSQSLATPPTTGLFLGSGGITP